MLANDMRSGMAVTLTHDRTGHLRCNKKGIIRTVEVPVKGQEPMTDVGDTYIDEILTVQDFEGDWSQVKLNDTHAKKLCAIHAQGW